LVGYADKLTERIDALADALRAAGVPQDRAASLLGSAATASMHALVLDAVLEEGLAPAEPEPVAQPQGRLQAAA
jgi:hypothetical protein